MIANKTISNQTMTTIQEHDFLCGDAGDDEVVGLKTAKGSNVFVHNSAIDEKSAGKITRYVLKNFKSLTQSEEFQDLYCNKTSNMTNKQTSSSMSQIRHSKLELGSCIGQGSFSSVYKVVSLMNDDSTNANIEADNVVVKVLRRKVTEDKAVFAAAASGLAKEGAILGSLPPHANIIQIRAFSTGGLSTYATGRNDAFFIVLDRLSEMLKDRMHRWSDMETHLMFALRHRQEKYRSFFLERLKVAAELANALSYLHKHNVLHRDIKPQNVGFDTDGTLKLFDFDVSRVLPKESYQDELFQLSIATGTQRYMSPECALSGRYNLKSDVYGFAILFHEILALECPYSGISKEHFSEVVFREGQRPRINDSWPTQIQSLLQNAWSEDIKVRPSMKHIHNDILQEIKEMEEQPQNSITRSKQKKRRIHLPVFKKTPTRRRGQHWPKQ